MPLLRALILPSINLGNRQPILIRSVVTTTLTGMRIGQCLKHRGYHVRMIESKVMPRLGKATMIVRLDSVM